MTGKNQNEEGQVSGLRLPAEWERHSFVQFTFPHRYSDWAYMLDEVSSCFAAIIRAAACFEPVLVVCSSLSDVGDLLQQTTPYPIRFAEIGSNDTWARDHGAITVLRDGKPLLYDFVFNGWGGKFEAALDDSITRGLSEMGVLPDRLQSFDFVLEGGSIESDGKGTLLTTSECLLSPARNPGMNKAGITGFLKEIFGLTNVLWLDHGYLAGDDTDSHIDTLARLCSPTTIAYVKCDDPGDEHYPELTEMEKQLKTFKNADGEYFNLVALPWPDACFDNEGNRLPATYANFLIVNGGVLVPLYGVRQDSEALEVMRSIFPDRTITGVDCRPLIEQHGSLHCISMQYPEGVYLNNDQHEGKDPEKNHSK